MPHTVYFGLGSNLGDRQALLAQAIGRLRSAFRVTAVSPAYETDPVGFTDQPRFINLCVEAETDSAPEEILGTLKDIERELGRRRDDAPRYGPRPIDIDLLFYDDAIVRQDALEIPHPQAADRAFVLVPLSDLAPDLRHPVLGRTIQELREAADAGGVERIRHGLLTGFERDVQEERPRNLIGLQRVGVTGLERLIQLETAPRAISFYATLDIFVDLPGEQKGAHMSRFPHLVEEALDELVFERAPDIESLAGRIADGIRTRQGAHRSECRIRAKAPKTRHAPLSGQRTQDVYTLLGWAASDGNQCPRLVGVEVEGMTACPCAQDMLRDHSRSRLMDAGYSRDDADRILGIVPIATHSQRGRGTLLVSDHPSINADDLLRVVEASMSSEIYGLLKRPDEFFVVNRAHRNPKFVEDVVRDMLGHVLAMYHELPPDAFAWARQVNFESIHAHDVTAERGGTFGELRAEAGGGRSGSGMGVETWFEKVLGSSPG